MSIWITKKWTIRISAIVLFAFLAFVSIAELAIGLGVRRFSQIAQEQFSGDRVGALVQMVECEYCDLRDRNHAVWALGQLADRRALPVLEKYCTGEECDHLHKICQYELKKALRLARSGHNSEALLWRWMLRGRD
jgi:HEAT repeat protein